MPVGLIWHPGPKLLSCEALKREDPERLCLKPVRELFKVPHWPEHTVSAWPRSRPEKDELGKLNPCRRALGQKQNQPTEAPGCPGEEPLP